MINQEAEGDNAHEPQGPEENRNAVQVPLDDGRRTEGGTHPAAEQVGQPAALTLVQQDEQDHHEAGDDQDNGEPDDHRCNPSPAGDKGPADRDAAADVSLRRQFTIPADLSELPGVEASAADQGPVDVRLRHDRRDVVGLDGPAIQDTHTGGRSGVMKLRNP